MLHEICAETRDVAHFFVAGVARRSETGVFTGLRSLLHSYLFQEGGDDAFLRITN